MKVLSSRLAYNTTLYSRTAKTFRNKLHLLFTIKIFHTLTYVTSLWSEHWGINFLLHFDNCPSNYVTSEESRSISYSCLYDKLNSCEVITSGLQLTYISWDVMLVSFLHFKLVAVQNLRNWECLEWLSVIIYIFRKLILCL
jgi:hypothetical protein